MKIFALFFLFSLSIFADDFSIERFHGDVSINGKKVNSNNIKSFTIKVGDTLVAGNKKSFIQVKSSRGSTFLVRGGSLKVDRFDKDSTVVELIKGKFFHYLNTTKKKRKFIVNTKTASLGVRGTKYMVEASDKKTYLCVCEGSVEIKSSITNKLYMTGAGKDIDILNTMADFKVRDSSKMMLDMNASEFAKMGHPLN